MLKKSPTSLMQVCLFGHDKDKMWSFHTTLLSHCVCSHLPLPGWVDSACVWAQTHPDDVYSFSCNKWCIKKLWSVKKYSSFFPTLSVSSAAHTPSYPSTFVVCMVNYKWMCPEKAAGCTHIPFWGHPQLHCSPWSLLCSVHNNCHGVISIKKQTSVLILCCTSSSSAFLIRDLWWGVLQV